MAKREIDNKSTGGVTQPDSFTSVSFETSRISQGEPINHTPNVDMYSTSEELTIEVELPGVLGDEIDVSMHGGRLIIRAVKYECFDEEAVNYICMERSFGKITREVELPFPVNTSKTKAIYSNGILTITMPTVADKRGTAKQIPIESK